MTVILIRSDALLISVHTLIDSTFNFNSIAKPYNNIDNGKHISFIITSRNDNYGENPILRLRFTLQNLLLFEWKKLYHVSIEIIVIEWNPVDNKPHLWEYKQIKQLLHHIVINNDTNNVIKFYSIPSKYNDRVNCFENQYCPFYEYHAKNVGLRRSKGQWKLIMNIDDLFGLNLLNFLGYSLKYNLLDYNGIYQAKKNEIKIENISKYLNVFNVIPVEDILKINKVNADFINKCYHKPKWWRFEKTKPIWIAGGDFTLIHNNSVYNGFGGYLELCQNHHLDSEFLRRNIFINELNTYYIDSICSYHHIAHYGQKRHRENFKNFISKNNNNKTVQCDQIDDDRYNFLWNGNTPSNHHWKQVVAENNKNWGLSEIWFEPIQGI